MYDLEFKLSEFTNQAMMYEVSCFPSIGLVSPVSSGSHKDMNFYTFIDSTSALNKYMFEFAKAGKSISNLKELFLRLREIGVLAEEEMFVKTKNVNTHKGMIFLLGLTVAGTAYCIENKLSFDSIKNIIKKMCSGITEELKEAEDKKQDELSHGEKLYLEYGITGVRGEAEAGIPLAFDIALKEYDKAKDLNENDRLVHTLLCIMKKCDDSTILHRHDFETLNYVKKISKELLNNAGLYNENNKKVLFDLNETFIEKNISPGGSADILAVTVFLSLVKKEFF